MHGPQLKTRVLSLGEELLRSKDTIKVYVDDIIQAGNTIDELKKEIKELKEELEVTDSILNERQKLLDAIPECPTHGKCMPHALDWIKKMKEIEEIRRS